MAATGPVTEPARSPAPPRAGRTRPVMTRPPIGSRADGLRAARACGGTAGGSATAGGMAAGHGTRRVLVHPSGFRQSPYADIRPPGDDAKTAPRKRGQPERDEPRRASCGTPARAAPADDVPDEPVDGRPASVAWHRARREPPQRELDRSVVGRPAHRRGLGRAARASSTAAGRPSRRSTSSTSAAAPAASPSRSPSSATGSPSSTPARTRSPRCSAGPARPASTVRAVQGDAAGLLEVVEPGSADLVLLPRRPRARRRPGAAPRGARRGAAPRRHPQPAGRASRNAVVLARALAGQFAEARHALDDPDGRWGRGDPLPRRFTEPRLARAARRPPGCGVEAVHGVRSVRRPRPRRAGRLRARRGRRPARARAATAAPAGVPRPSRPSCTSARRAPDADWRDRGHR